MVILNGGSYLALVDGRVNLLNVSDLQLRWQAVMLDLKLNQVQDIFGKNMMTEALEITHLWVQFEPGILDGKGFTSGEWGVP